MAAAIARHYFGRRMAVESAGVEARDIDPFAVLVMNEEGIDLSAHKSKTFAALDQGVFDLIVTLTPEAHHNALDLTRTFAVDVEYWPTLDPTVARDLGRPRDQIVEAYRAVRDELKARILSRFSQDFRESLRPPALILKARRFIFSPERRLPQKGFECRKKISWSFPVR